MVSLLSLWLPILLSSVIVFVVSSIIHMMSPWHKNDYPKLENEEKILDALRGFSIPGGDYMMPMPSARAELRSSEFAERMKKGPLLTMTIWPGGAMNMSKPLIMWFLYSVVMGIFGGYVAGRALPTGAEYLQVFRFVGTTTFLGYAAALWQMSIWYRRSLRTTFKLTIDGLVYALVTAGTFGWLWPR